MLAARESTAAAVVAGVGKALAAVGLPSEGAVAALEARLRQLRSLSAGKGGPAGAAASVATMASAATESTSLLGTAWSWAVGGLLCFFLASTIQEVARQR